MATHTHKEEETKKHEANQSMSPAVAAAIGAVVGAAGGVAVAMAYQNPEIQKKAKEQFDMLSKKATDAWNKVNEQPMAKELSAKAGEKLAEAVKDKTETIMPSTKTEKKSSAKTDLK